MIKIVCQQLIRQSLILFVLIFLVIYLAASEVDDEIFAPPRRALHAFQLEQLNNPAEFGLRVRHHACLSGRAPCLLVEPDAQAGPGVRGKVLREQMAAAGVQLPAYGNVHAILVMLHGRNGRKESLLAVAERFVAAGFRCLIPDLPAHGESTMTRLNFGGDAFERALPLRVLTEMREHFGLPEEPAALWGLSMGGAVAVSAAADDQSRWQALVVVSSFAALDDVLKHYIPSSYAPYAGGVIGLLDMTRWFQGKPTVSSIRPRHWAKQLSIPTLVVHGDADVYVPMAQGRQLFAALSSSNKQWLTVPGGGHRNVLSTPMQLYSAMSQWLWEVIK